MQLIDTVKIKPTLFVLIKPHGDIPLPPAMGWFVVGGKFGNSNVQGSRWTFDVILDLSLQAPTIFGA